MPLISKDAMARYKAIEEAAKAVVDDFTERNQGEEVFKSFNVSGVDFPYWSPAGVIVKSELIAALRKLLNNARNTKPVQR